MVGVRSHLPKAGSGAWGESSRKAITATEKGIWDKWDTKESEVLRYND